MVNFDEAKAWLKTKGFDLRYNRIFETWRCVDLGKDINVFVYSGKEGDITKAVNEAIEKEERITAALRGELPPSAGSLDISPYLLFARPVGVQALQDIEIIALVEGRWQPRKSYDPEELKELASSIKANGLVSRPMVFINEHSQYELIGGHRRTLAAIVAGLEHIPIEIKSLTAQQAMEHSLIDNFNRSDLTPVEEGKAYDLMLSLPSMTQAALSKRLGIARGKIQQRLELINAAPEVAQAVEEGMKLGVIRGVLSVAKGYPELQQRVLKAIDKKTSERGAKELTFEYLLGHSYNNELIRNHLEGLGWSIGRYWKQISKGESAYLYRIWSGSDRPRLMTAKRIYQIIDFAKRPLQEAEIIRIHAEWLTVARLFHIHFDAKTFTPWIMTDHNQFLSEEDLLDLLAPCFQKIEMLKLTYSDAGYELKMDTKEEKLYVYKDGAEIAKFFWYQTAREASQDDFAFFKGKEPMKCNICGATEGLKRLVLRVWGDYCGACIKADKAQKREAKKRYSKKLTSAFAFVQSLRNRDRTLLAYALGCHGNIDELEKSLVKAVYSQASQATLDKLLGS
jgi:ParB/RepB/Spo0J family partition protein